MTDLTRLREAHADRGRPSAAAELTEALGLDELDLRVISATVYGRRGPRAPADLRLSNGAVITFERFDDVSKPTALSAYLVGCLGLVRSFKGPEASAVAALLFRLAEQSGADAELETATEWGSEFLRVAPQHELDMSVQEQRWEAFSVLRNADPSAAATATLGSRVIAERSVVLVDCATGVRYVRCGWYLAYVRREVGGQYSPATLATLMQRAGWIRPSSTAQIKATAPSRSETLHWSFYLVERGWEERS